MSWELRLVENMGDLVGSDKTESVVVPTETLIEDMKKQLKFLPKNFTWTVGWRTYVWQETETKEFKELTEGEHKKLYAGEHLNQPEDGGESDNASGLTPTTEGKSTE
jgi:hypothetical protein